MVYTHGLDVDRPLGILRIGYTHPTSSGYAQFDNVAVTPHYNWRGLPDLDSHVNGAATRCTGTGSAQQCVELVWPAGFSAFQQQFYRPSSWFGTLPEQKMEVTGQAYRRNRYYDPQSGRFTQEDPIGLAGGMNLYGFADGDPVNFSDPFGLCPKESGGDGQTPYNTDCPPGTHGYMIVCGCVQSTDAPWEILFGARSVVTSGVRGAVSYVGRQAAQRTIENARRRAVRRAWQQERDRVRRTGQGSREWTAAERDELLATGRVKGYEGHHRNSVAAHTDQAGDPDNIEFLMRDEHFRAHGGNWRNPTPRDD
ncbi:MAG: RHS repeat-associated core domain-containing protein [Gemmatimonadaceae bacterium]